MDVSCFFLRRGVTHAHTVMLTTPTLLVSILGIAAPDVLGASIDTGMMGMGGCCMEKVVGNITYLIAEENTGKTQAFGCSEDCVYIRMDETAGQMYCFQPGNLEVSCSSPGNYSTPPPPSMSPSTSVTSAPVTSPSPTSRYTNQLTTV